MVFIFETPEQQQDRLLQPLVDDDPAADHLGDAGLAVVEQVDGLADQLAGALVAGLELGPVLPEVVDLRLEVSHGPQATAAPVSSSDGGGGGGGTSRISKGSAAVPVAGGPQPGAAVRRLGQPGQVSPRAAAVAGAAAAPSRRARACAPRARAVPSRRRRSVRRRRVERPTRRPQARGPSSGSGSTTAGAATRAPRCVGIGRCERRASRRLRGAATAAAVDRRGSGPLTGAWPGRAPAARARARLRSTPVVSRPITPMAPPMMPTSQAAWSVLDGARRVAATDRDGEGAGRRAGVDAVQAGPVDGDAAQRDALEAARVVAELAADPAQLEALVGLVEHLELDAGGGMGGGVDGGRRRWCPGTRSRGCTAHPA